MPGKEFFPGFAWAIPTAFRDALAKCLFEEGDLLYDKPEAYNLRWDEAMQIMQHSIQVRFPKRSAVTGEAEAFEGIFERNWNSELVLDLTEYPSRVRRQIKTFQGSLYTFLWKGSLDVLMASPKQLPPPPSLADLNRAFDAINHEKIIHLFPETKSAVCFLTPLCLTHSISVAKQHLIAKELREFPDRQRLDLSPADIGLHNADLYRPTFQVRLYSIGTKQVEKVKDALKQALYKPAKDTKEPGKHFKLRNHGLFLSPKAPSERDIIVHGFKHLKGAFYRYRFSHARTRLLPITLAEYLRNCPDDCPNQYFLDPPHCSDVCQGFNLHATIYTDDKTGIQEAIKNLPAERSVQSLHEHLQKYLLETDPNTIACEVPLWLFGSQCTAPIPIKPDDVLTGHIDLLRYSDGKVWIWDFKPGAVNETKASQQIYLYSLMLSRLASIPLSEIACGYFDEEHVFWFEPDKAELEGKTP